MDEHLQSLEEQFEKTSKKKKSMLSRMMFGSPKKNCKINAPATTVTSLMQAFFRSEEVSEWKCDKCLGKGCTKTILVDAAPNTLSINVSRAHGSSFFGHVSRRVEFKEEFDLSQFLTSNAANDCKDGKCQYALFAVVVYRFLQEY